MLKLIKLKIGVSFFLLMILFIPLHANSQFLNPDAKWTVHTFGCPEGCYESYSDIQILKDSIIDDINYSIFEYLGLLLAVREDSDKVFFKVLKDDLPDPDSDTLEHVLYDFSLTTGDSILLELPRDYYYTKRYWKVFEMDSVLVGNEYKKRFRLSADRVMEQYWIEDIGSTFGPFYISKSLGGEFTKKLHCYQVNGEQLYGDCSHVGVNPLPTSNKISLEYDPVYNQIKIELPNYENCTLTIYSLLGIKVFQKNIPGNEYCNLPDIGNGLFLFEIQTGSQWHCEKIYI